MIEMRLALTFDGRRSGREIRNASLALSPDGRCFAIVAGKCRITLWDVQTGTHMMTLEYAGEILSLEFVADDQLASGNPYGEILVWDIVTGTRVRTVEAHCYWIFSLSASQSKLASGSWDKTAQVWDTTSWECMCTFECDSHVTSVALYPNCDRVAACTSKIVYVWDTTTQQLIVSKNLSECNGVAVSSDGKWLAVASSATSLYDASTLDCVWSHDRDSSFVSFSLDSSQLVSIRSQEVVLLDVQTGNCVKSFHHLSVARAVVSHDGTRLLSGESCSRSVNRLNLIHLPASALGSCRLWDLYLGEEDPGQDLIRSVKFSEDGSLLAVKQWEDLELRKTSNWELLWSVRCDGGRVDFSHDGLRVLVEDDEDHVKKVHAYDVRSGHALGEIDSIPESMHDHVHWVEEEGGYNMKCLYCKSSLLKDGEYWFTYRDKWLWIMGANWPRRLIHIPEEYTYHGFKTHSGHIVGGHKRLLVLDTTRL